VETTIGSDLFLKVTCKIEECNQNCEHEMAELFINDLYSETD
jgi:hypothetical protein